MLSFQGSAIMMMTLINDKRNCILLWIEIENSTNFLSENIQNITDVTESMFDLIDSIGI